MRKRIEDSTCVLLRCSTAHKKLNGSLKKGIQSGVQASVQDRRAVKLASVQRSVLRVFRKIRYDRHPRYSSLARETHLCDCYRPPGIPCPGSCVCSPVLEPDVEFELPFTDAFTGTPIHETLPAQWTALSLSDKPEAGISLFKAESIHQSQLESASGDSLSINDDYTTSSGGPASRDSQLDSSFPIRPYTKMQATDEKVLVYHFRAEGEPVVDKAMAVITRKELEDIMASRKFSPSLRCTTTFALTCAQILIFS